MNMPLKPSKTRNSRHRCQTTPWRNNTVLQGPWCARDLHLLGSMCPWAGVARRSSASGWLMFGWIASGISFYGFLVFLLCFSMFQKNMFFFCFPQGPVLVSGLRPPLGDLRGWEERSLRVWECLIFLSLFVRFVYLVGWLVSLSGLFGWLVS